MRIPIGLVGSERADCSDGSGGASNMVGIWAEVKKMSGWMMDVGKPG